MLARRAPVLVCGMFAALVAGVPAVAATYTNISGVSVEFPEGAVSFADRLVDLDIGLVADPDGGFYNVSPFPPAAFPPGTMVPLPFARFGAEALGIPDQDLTSAVACYTAVAPNLASNTSPDCNFVSLGVGGSITVQFEDNFLVGDGTSADDLWVFEIGPDIEDTFVDISKDGVVFTSVGKVFGSTFGVDIDAFGFGPGDAFRFVRLTDDAAEGEIEGGTVGADIDSIGAISTAPVPAPAALWLFGPALGATLAAAARRRSPRQPR